MPPRERGPIPIATAVQARYDGLAQQGASTLCCSPDQVYSAEELAEIPEWVKALSSSCGAPLDALELPVGATVADFGCGAGLDLIIAARRVGPGGRVIGIDGSLEMVRAARRAAAELQLGHVQVRVGDIRRPPLRDDSVDVLLSNCVLSMFPDKAEILAEMIRVLRPGGQAIISDAVLAQGTPTGGTPTEGDPAPERSDDWERCVVGLTADEYRDLMLAAGFTDVQFRNQQPVVYRDGAALTSVTVVATTGSTPLARQSCC